MERKLVFNARDVVPFVPEESQDAFWSRLLVAPMGWGRKPWW